MGVRIPPPLPGFVDERNLPAGGSPPGGIESEMAQTAVREEPESPNSAKGLWNQFRNYASEVKIETKRVTWPGFQEVYGTTVMVVLTTFLFGIFFWICDQVFQYSVVNRLLGHLMHRG
jgi:preprotein translocase SecE subunit